MTVASQILDALKPLLSEPRDHLDAIVDVLTGPGGARPDRPWMRQPLEGSEAVREIWQAAVKAMAPLLADPEPSSRVAVCAVLQVAPTKAAGDLARGLLSADGQSTVPAALDVLAQVGDEEFVDDIVPLLEHDVAEARYRAAAALGAIGADTALAALLARLEREPDWAVRSSILRSLGELGDSAALPALLGRLSDPQLTNAELRGVVDGLPNIGQPALDALSGRLEDVTGEMLYRTINAMAAFESAAATRQLHTLIDHADPNARVHAAVGLADQGDPLGWETLLKTIQIGETPAALLAAVRLVERGRAPGLPLLLDHYFDPALGPLARVGAFQLHDVLTEALIDELSADDPNRVRAAADIVGIKGARAAESQLEELAGQMPAAVAMAAATALVRLDSKQGLSAFDTAWNRLSTTAEKIAAWMSLSQQWQPLPLPLLDRLLEDSSTPVVSGTLELLGSVDADVAMPRLLAVLEAHTPSTHETEPDQELQETPLSGELGVFPEMAHLIFPFMDDAMVERQRAALRCRGPRLVLTVARVLMYQGAPGSTAPSGLGAALEDQLTADAPMVRFAAAAVLEKMWGDGALGALERLTSDDDALVRFLVQSKRFERSDSRLEAAEALTTDDESWVRLGAVVLFEQWASDEARPWLERLADDPSERVRVNAKGALERLFGPLL